MFNACLESGSGETLRTVSRVEIDRYVGVWYEIAKIPNRFQKRCAGNTTATYTLHSDGRLSVINQCEESEGAIARVEGLAKITDTVSNAKLKVSFFRIFGLPVYLGDYWIIGLDEDYRWAVVGTPGRKYGWILSRTPFMDEQSRKKVDAVLKENKYRPEDFVSTRHTR